MPAPSTLSRFLLEGEPSFRDLGGCPTSDGGKVRDGMLFRSGLLRTLTERDERRLRNLGIAWRLDLRNRAEQMREASATALLGEFPSADWDGERELEGVQPSQWAQRFQDPNFTPAKVRELFLESYWEMPRALAPALGVLFERLLQAEAAPVLIHCTAGKDRTGFVCALLLIALGAEGDAVLADYLRSNEHMPDPFDVLARYRKYEAIEPHADAATTVDALYRSEPDYLDCALRRIRTDWGSVETYLRAVAGYDDTARAALRNKLLTHG